MNSPQQSLASLAQRPSYGVHSIRDAIDEDVALGCECADPVLQIDCWGEETGKLAAERD
jgi:hypothetical protein